MKIKAILIVAALLAVGVNATAQRKSDNSTRFGVVGGVNISNVRTGDIDLVEFDPKAGFHAGIFVDMPLISNLHLQPELLYTQRGTKRSTEVAGVVTDIETKLNYIQLPVELSLRIPVAMLTVDAIVGPYASVGLNGKNTVKTHVLEKLGIGESSKIESTEGIFKDDGDNKAAYKRVDFGLRFGAGVHLFKKLGVSLYYDLGVIDIQNKDAKGVLNSVSEEYKTKNGSFQVSCSLAF